MSSSSFVIPVDLVEADIYICGFGLQVPQEVTLETLAILRIVKRVFCLPYVNLATVGTVVQTVDLGIHYAATTDRELSYQRMADDILSCMEDTRPVAFVTYGHPAVGTSVTRLLTSAATKLQLRTHIANAPSSIEAVCARLEIDPFEGVQVWDATAYVERKPIVASDSTLFLMQVPYVGSRRATHLADGHRFSASALRELRDCLIERYTSEHTVYFVRVPVLGYGLSITSTILSSLVTNTPENSSTLVVPPAHRTG